MNANRPLIIAVVVVVLAAVGGYKFLVDPPRKDAADVQTQIDTQQAALQSAQTALQTAEQAKAQYRAAYTEVLRLGKAVPEDDDLQSLLVQLSATAKRSKVDFLSLERGDAASGAVSTGTGQTTTQQLPPGATVGAAGFPAIGLTLTFSGSYFHLTDFLRRLHGYVGTGKALRVNGRLLTLSGFKLAQTGGAGKLTATVGATAYVVSPVEGATGGATSSAPAPSGAVAATPTPAGTPSNG